jgi:hypothetical protein
MKLATKHMFIESIGECREYRVGVSEGYGG